MSDQIATSFSRKYAEGIELTAQQITSELESTLDVYPNPVGEIVFWDQVGVVRMQPKTGTAIDIPTLNTPHRRRALHPQDFQHRDFIDKFDTLKTLNNPINDYTKAHVAAGQRKKDKVIIDALLGDAYTGKLGTTVVALPAAQKIVNGATGFTFAKLQEGIRLLRQRNAIMKGEAVTVVYTSFQEKEFMNVAEVKSVDYNTQKVLVEGEIGTFYTCFFKRVEDEYDDDANVVRFLPLAATIRSCLMYPKSAGKTGTWLPLSGVVEWVVEKHVWQVVPEMSFGAARGQETKVVQIDVVEA